MEPQVECLGDDGGLIFDEEISSPVKIPKPKIVAPILQTPLVILEANQPVLKTVADVEPAEVKSENPVPAPPVTVYLDAPPTGDGVTGAAFRGGYAKVSDSSLVVWHAHGRAQQDQVKNILGLR